MKSTEQQDIYKKIHDQTLFKGLPDDEFTILMNQCKLNYYRKAEKVDYFKTPDEGLLLILQGMAEVFIVVEEGKSTVLEVLQEGEVIGFSNIAYYLGESNRPLDRHHLEIEVVEDSYCLQIPYTVVQQRLHNEAVRDSILRRMSIRLANVYASLGEQAKSADDWGESEPYVRRVEDLMNSPAMTVTEDVAVIAGNRPYSGGTIHQLFNRRGLC